VVIGLGEGLDVGLLRDEIDGALEGRGVGRLDAFALGYAVGVYVGSEEMEQ
jgi:hypothetical protein